MEHDGPHPLIHIDSTLACERSNIRAAGHALVFVDINLYFDTRKSTSGLRLFSFLVGLSPIFELIRNNAFST